MKFSNYENTLIIIPVYNCEKHLHELFDKIKSISNECNILCVNDGSKDNSLHYIKQYKIKYIDLGRNRGKGYALKMAFLYAKRKGFEYALTMDADLQHDPSLIPNFIKTQNVFKADLVIGFRNFSFKNMPFARVFSNSITSSIVSFASKKKVLDSQSGYRLYDLSFFDENEIKTNRYQMETEILLKYIQKGAKIYHTEIPVIYNDEKSNISHFRDIVNFIKVIGSQYRFKK
ncbi:MAG: glycosyltransferase family 2 protein [Candidatus Cloacimonetes bacterium]|nr:glycosyltransferase family 2 protein [Candidatus Cloacimonadota bacterium]